VSDELNACVSNSLAWYKAIMRTHGVAGETVDGVWWCRGQVPPYYSNAITLTPSAQETALAVLKDLRRSLRPPFTVKDSFANLDLAPLGMRPFIDASWVRLDFAAGRFPSTSGAEWRQVANPEELERWEAAWREDASPAEVRVFVPGLLDMVEISLLALFRGDRIVAGCAVNRSPGAAGFSNFFAMEGERDAHLASAIGAAVRHAAGAPLVGWERGQDLVRMRQLGFMAVGPLRVWITNE
jgi:hypothetical protein